MSPTPTITASKQPNNYHFPTSKSFTNTSIKHQHKRRSCQHLVHVRQQQQRNDVNNRTTTTTVRASPSQRQASNTKTNVNLIDILYVFDNNNNATTQTTEQLPLPYEQVLHKDKHQTPRRTSISSTSCTRSTTTTTQTTEQLPLPYQQVLHKDKHQTPRQYLRRTLEDQRQSFHCF